MRRLCPLSTLVVLALAICGCATARPAWVVVPPEEPGQAVAVGVATGRASLEEARRAAEAAAVAQLASRFGFSARLEYRETARETWRGTGASGERSVEERLETEGPRVKLAAPEVVARHEEKTAGGWSAYVLVRYPLSAIREEQERLRAEAEAARMAPALALSRAKAALAGGEVGCALPLLAEALHAPDPIVSQQARAELGRLAAGLLLEPLPVAGQVTLAGPGEPLRVRATFNGLAAVGVPVRFAFVAGAGELEPLVRTGAGGVAVSRVSRLEPAPLYVVRAEAELPTCGGPRLAGPRTEIGFRLKDVPWRVYVEVAEENLGAAQAHSLVAAEISQVLAGAGVALAATKDEAEVVVAGTAASREGSDNLGWENAAVADVRLRAVLAAGGRVLSEPTLSAAEFSDTAEQAGVRALKRAGREAALAVLQALLAAAP